jgi:hypothetical protein
MQIKRVKDVNHQALADSEGNWLEGHLELSALSLVLNWFQN